MGWLSSLLAWILGECSVCEGTGKGYDGKGCKACSGTGLRSYQHFRTCHVCQGTTRTIYYASDDTVRWETCWYCKGEGIIRD